MNPKILAASVATLLVAAGMFVYLGTGLSAAEPIQPAAAEAGFAGQERREVEAWMPAPGMGTLADASIEALHEISVGASPSEALQKASSTRSLSLNEDLEDWFTPEAVQNCQFRYWFMSDSYVNSCDPFSSFETPAGKTVAALPPSWQATVAVYGVFYAPDYGSGGQYTYPMPAWMDSRIGSANSASVPYSGAPIGTVSGQFTFDYLGTADGTVFGMVYAGPTTAANLAGMDTPDYSTFGDAVPLMEFGDLPGWASQWSTTSANVQQTSVIIASDGADHAISGWVQTPDGMMVFNDVVPP